MSTRVSSENVIVDVRVSCRWCYPSLSCVDDSNSDERKRDIRLKDRMGAAIFLNTWRTITLLHVKMLRSPRHEKWGHRHTYESNLYHDVGYGQTIFF